MSSTSSQIITTQLDNRPKLIYGNELEWYETHMFDQEISLVVEGNNLYSTLLNDNTTLIRQFYWTCWDALQQQMAHSNITMRFDACNIQAGESGSITIKYWTMSSNESKMMQQWLEDTDGLKFVFSGHSLTALPFLRPVSTSADPTSTQDTIFSNSDASPIIGGLFGAIIIVFFIALVLLYLHKGKPIVDKNGFTSVHKAVIVGDVRALEDILRQPPYGPGLERDKKSKRHGTYHLGNAVTSLTPALPSNTVLPSSHADMSHVQAIPGSTSRFGPSLSDGTNIPQNGDKNDPLWGSSQSLANMGASHGSYSQAVVGMPINGITASSSTDEFGLGFGHSQESFGQPSLVSNPMFDSQSLGHELEVDLIKEELKTSIAEPSTSMETSFPVTSKQSTSSNILDDDYYSQGVFPSTSGPTSPESQENEMLASSSSSESSGMEMTAYPSTTCEAIPTSTAAMVLDVSDEMFLPNHPHSSFQEPQQISSLQEAPEFVEDVSVTISATDSNDTTLQPLNPLRLQRLDTDSQLRRSELLNQRDRSGSTAIVYAVRMKSVEMLTTLALHGADVNIPTLENMSPLHFACLEPSQDIRMIKTLLEFGANPNALNAELSTPLSFAAINGKADVALALLSAGAQMQVPDVQGMTPLLLAAAHGHSGVVRVLCQHDPSSINVTDSSGWTSLHWAVAGNSIPCIEVLLSFPGVNIEARNHQGETIMHLAARSGNPKLVTLLSQRFGENPNLKSLTSHSNLGITPSIIARHRNQPDASMTLFQLEKRAAESSTSTVPRLKKRKAENLSGDGSAKAESQVVDAYMVKDEPMSPDMPDTITDAPLMYPRPPSLSPNLSTSDGSGVESDKTRAEDEKRRKRRLYMRKRRQQEREKMSEMERKVKELDQRNRDLNTHIERLRHEKHMLHKLVSENP